MTYQPYPTATPPPAPNAGKGKLFALIAGGVLGGLVLLGAIGAAVGDDENTAAATTTATGAAATRPARTTTPAPAVVYDVPSVANIAPELTVTEKQCFGSAGCIFRYELRITSLGPVNFDPAKSYRVTIAIDEGTTWERIHSLEVKGAKADVVTGHVSSDTHNTPVATIQTVTAR
ncbi:hypothetical protein FOH10_07380 [Nocardia otitidiscaviarum]|uniref:Uncharacterized protein n=1 Tax=Nocardia otitidiscaviarum TaxID=1823 RepID=A0A516NI47_9NOCA|nr:hypothetical protein [Nocardia otitidiscaviarum]MCP9619929.1 hypothetical protein [Nocardia otitidiscaviarum]QDP78588.1 hypothetical protein FOH10_07380 [Nocardia otitidiscaviarum]